jgi:hypothetical protein
MKPLGNKKQNSLSRNWTKAMRKTGKAKGRQDNKKEIEALKACQEIDE